jgi:bile acid:Na+ symporter, BASS family
MGALTDTVMPIALGIIMLGLGLTLVPDDFRRVAKVPRAVFVGLFCQMVLLPLIAFGIAKLFALPPMLAVGLMLLSAAPGGPSANLFSHLASGDVALNITLTAMNSILSVISLPVIVGLALSHFVAEDKQIPLQLGKILQVFGVILLPVSLGMVIRGVRPKIAFLLEKPVRIFSVLFLLALIVGAVMKERANMGSYFLAVGVPALVFNLCCLGVGYAVPRLVRISERQAIAIGMEIGIHNGTLAIAIATTVLKSSVAAIPAAIYSLMMFFTAAAFGALVSRRAKQLDEPTGAP